MFLSLFPTRREMFVIVLQPPFSEANFLVWLPWRSHRVNYVKLGGLEEISIKPKLTSKENNDVAISFSMKITKDSSS